MKHNANLIIMVDNELCIGSISNIQIVEGRNRIEVEYDPGNLMVNQIDYKKLKMAKSDLVLYFEYYQYEGSKQTLYNYELPFSPDWLDQDYTVLRIYNLDNKKYKGVFEPLDKGRNYTYELDYPGGQMLRVRNKGKKNRE